MFTVKLISRMASLSGGSNTRVNPLPYVYTECIFTVWYEWDLSKAEENLLKHGIDFEDAIAIFDGLTVEQDDTRFSYGEARTRAIGALGSILITVIYTMRGEACRIISARGATRNERKAYREGQGR